MLASNQTSDVDSDIVILLPQNATKLLKYCNLVNLAFLVP